MDNEKASDVFEKFSASLKVDPLKSHNKKYNDLGGSLDNLSLREQEELRRYVEDTRHRKGLVYWVKWVVSVSLALTFLILIFNHFFKLTISDTVLVALLTTTTANILGLAAILLRAMFK